MKSVSALPKLGQGQSKLLQELRNVQDKQQTMDDKLESLSSKRRAMENDLIIIKTLKEDLRAVDAASKELSQQVSRLALQQDSLENN